MDKATTALMATEDNAAAIRALGNSLRSQIDKNTEAIEELKNADAAPHRMLTSDTNLLVNTFGTIKSDGTLGVIMFFEGTDARTVMFCNKLVGDLTSPAMFVLPEGEGNLIVMGRDHAQALFLSGSTIIPAKA